MPEFSTAQPLPIYSYDPKDAWNRIFNLLFTRRLKVRLSAEYPDAAPFLVAHGNAIPEAQNLTVSTRVFERLEVGDRAIEPLYPSFLTSAGPVQILTDPHYSEIEQALTEALAQTILRTPLARALMQSDAWAAYDLIYGADQGCSDAPEFRARKAHLLSLLRALIKKVALSTTEIESLPQNCVALSRKYPLLNFFSPSTSWIEVEVSPHRSHDQAVNFRRSARIFVRPVGEVPEKLRFAQSLRDFTIKEGQGFPRNLEAVALVIQNLLIDSDGKIVVSPLIQDVQLRRFVRDDKGNLVKTELREFELSRRLLLESPSNCGFLESDDNSSVFKPAAGNDYTFASPFPLGAVPPNPPLMVKLSSRCADCHGAQQTFLMSLAIQFPSASLDSAPRVRILPTEQNEHASYVIERKAARDNFRSIR